MTGPDEAWCTTWGHEARQTGTPPSTTKAHGQVVSDNGRQVPQIRTARKQKTNHGMQKGARQHPPPSGWTCAHPAANSSPASYGTAAFRMDVCAPGGYTAAAGYETAVVQMEVCLPGGHTAPAGYKKPPSRWMCARLAASPSTRKTADPLPTSVERSHVVRDTAHTTCSTTHGGSTPVNGSHVAEHTAHTTQHTECTHR